MNQREVTPKLVRRVLHKSALPGTLLIVILIISSCHHAEPPAIVRLLALDPTDSTHGIIERMSASGSQIIDSESAPREHNLKASSASGPVIRFQQGGQATFAINITPASSSIQELIVNCGDPRKNLSIPAPQPTGQGRSRNYEATISLDSSLEPGIFEIKIAAKDTAGRISNWTSKWVVIGGAVARPDSNLPSRWLMIRSTNVGWQHGHYIQFDTLMRFGEWALPGRNGIEEDLLAAYVGLESSPNWDAGYRLSSDTVYLLPETHNNYHIIALNNKKLILKETAGGDNRFGVFGRVAQTANEMP